MIDGFRKMGYTEEQCQELKTLSAINDCGIADIDIYDAEKTLSDVIKKYQLNKDEVSKIVDKFNQMLNYEEIKMNDKVKSFLKMINDGMEVDDAINKSGISELSMYVLLNEIAKAWSSVDLDRMKKDVDDVDSIFKDCEVGTK